MMFLVVQLFAFFTLYFPVYDAFLTHDRFGISKVQNLQNFKMAVDGKVPFNSIDGSNVRVGIIKARWNKEITNSLVLGVREGLKEFSVKEEFIFETEVPGSFELPLAARYLALSKTVDAIVCIGTLIKGDTSHYENICSAVSQGLMDVGLSTGVPTVFGVLTCLNEEQAKARSSGTNNHGVDWGKTAVEMGLLRMAALGQMGDAGKPKKILFGASNEASESIPPGEKKKVFF